MDVGYVMSFGRETEGGEMTAMLETALVAYSPEPQI